MPEPLIYVQPANAGTPTAPSLRFAPSSRLDFAKRATGRDGTRTNAPKAPKVLQVDQVIHYREVKHAGGVSAQWLVRFTGFDGGIVVGDRILRDPIAAATALADSFGEAVAVPEKFHGDDRQAWFAHLKEKLTAEPEGTPASAAPEAPVLETPAAERIGLTRRIASRLRRIMGV